MITKGAKALIIAAIDGTALTDVLQQAADADIPVIAYDRLIRDTQNVDYYATFDNFKVGVQQALAAHRPRSEKRGRPGRRAAGPFNIELFAGSPDDNNATFFFNGAMEVLKPYIDKGTLVVKSRPDQLQAGRHPALGRRHRAEAHGGPPHLDLLGRHARSTPCSRPTTASPSASSRR